MVMESLQKGSIQLEIFAYTHSCTNNKTNDFEIKYLYIY